LSIFVLYSLTKTHQQRHITKDNLPTQWLSIGPNFLLKFAGPFTPTQTRNCSKNT